MKGARQGGRQGQDITPTAIQGPEYPRTLSSISVRCFRSRTAQAFHCSHGNQRTFPLLKNVISGAPFPAHPGSDRLSGASFALSGTLPLGRWTRAR